MRFKTNTLQRIVLFAASAVFFCAAGFTAEHTMVVHEGVLRFLQRQSAAAILIPIVLMALIATLFLLAALSPRSAKIQRSKSSKKGTNP